MPVGHYVSNAGIRSGGVELKQEQFGKNLLSVKPPNFVDLYKEQLLSPLAMFQFFTAALWMMDEYWQYTMFSIFNILMFESTTVFQRLKTLNTLNGMSTKYVHAPQTLPTKKKCEGKNGSLREKNRVLQIPLTDGLRQDGGIRVWWWA